MITYPPFYEDAKNPYRILAEDMTNDVLDNLAGIHKSIDRVLAKKRDEISLGSMAFIASGLYVVSHDFKTTSSEPQLFADIHADSIRSDVMVAASFTGNCILHEVLDEQNKYWGKRIGYHQSAIKLSDSDSAISLDQWVASVWAPDYTERFVDAAVQMDASSQMELEYTAEATPS